MTCFCENNIILSGPWWVTRMSKKYTNHWKWVYVPPKTPGDPENMLLRNFEPVVTDLINFALQTSEKQWYIYTVCLKSKIYQKLKFCENKEIKMTSGNTLLLCGLKKDILSLKEIDLLYRTEVSNNEIKNASKRAFNVFHRYMQIRNFTGRVPFRVYIYLIYI